MLARMRASRSIVATRAGALVLSLGAGACSDTPVFYDGGIDARGDELAIGGALGHEVDPGSGGARLGMAFVLRSSAGELALAQELFPPRSDWARGHSAFGTSVAAAERWLAVGDGRCVRVYERERDGWSHEPRAKLEEPADPHFEAEMLSEACFGAALAARGDELLVGAPYDGSFDVAGRVFLYRHDGAGWTVEVATARAADPDFGAAVALGDGVAVVGGASPVHVWERASDAAWGSAASLTPPSEGAYTRFGASVAVDGTTIAVGQPGRPEVEAPHDGAVCLFERTGEGWRASARVVADGGAERVGFGAAVDLAGDTLLVGAGGYDWGSGGGAHVFTRADRGWTRQARLEPPGGAPAWFGRAVRLAGARAFVASRHAVHVFARDEGGAWTWTQTLRAPRPSAAMLERLPRRP